MNISYIAEGYEVVTDPSTGEVSYYVVLSTGERKEPVRMTAPEGSYCVTPERQRIDYERRKQREVLFRKKEVTNLLGKYYSMARDNECRKLSAATAARLVYLGTFLRYGTDCLFKTRRTPLNSKMLPKVMRLSEDTVSRFLKEARDFVFVDEEGNLHMPGPTFVHGKLPAEHAGYQKMRIEAIRSLYLSTSAENHKRLGYIFLMLPFVSVEFNILCHRPYEVGLEDIQPMTVKEFCEEVGLTFNKMTVSRLRKIYSEIQFVINGERELFCAFITDGVHHENDRIFVNPRVLYSGSDISRVQALLELMPKPHSNDSVTTLR